MGKLEKALGHKRFMIVKQFIKYIRDILYFVFHKRIQLITSDIELTVLGKKKKHVFFGYYDIQQLNTKEEKVLVHVVDKNAKTSINKAELGFYNINNKKYEKISETSAWNWQQGSRLRWWPTDDNYVCYNDVIDNEYVCKKININTKKVDSVFCKALYDIDPQGTYGLSLNFSRLQRLRPGYGYDSIKDDTINISSPTKDGIYYVDLLKNESQLIISLKKLAEKCYDKNADQHYINHISISPNGEKFIFFHIWTIKNSDKWKTCLYVSNKKGTELKILERDDLVSHYDWIDSNNILITGYTKEKKQIYSIYNTITAKKTILPSEYLNKDGHPTIINKQTEFISDTYPKRMDLQELFHYDLLTNRKKTILYIYSSPLMYEEKRCDLHPRISRSERIITIDSTFNDNCKKVILIKKGEKYEK